MYTWCHFAVMSFNVPVRYFLNENTEIPNACDHSLEHWEKGAHLGVGFGRDPRAQRVCGLRQGS